MRGLKVAAGFAVLLLAAGCRQDMHNQPKMLPQQGSDFFADHRGARSQVAGTVERGELREDNYFYTGLVQGANGHREERNSMPFPVTMEVLKRGQERFNIYCAPCHFRVGDGLGMIVQRGLRQAANFHDQVRLSQPISHYFYVMTRGYGAMPDYSAQLTPADRWAVAAYIRVLQLSQAATLQDVPAGVDVRDLKENVTGKQSPQELGAGGIKLLEAKGCLVCHTVDGTPGIGPTLKGAWGAQVHLAGGSVRTLDAAFFAQKVGNPAGLLVSGFAPVMPFIPLTEEEVNEIEAYLQGLK